MIQLIVINISAPVFGALSAVALTIPFYAPFTVDLGFPLKIFEIFGVLAILYYFLMLCSVNKIYIFVSKYYLYKIVSLFLVLISYVLLSGVANLFIFNADVEIALDRDRVFDFFSRLMYLVFNFILLTLFLTVKAGRLNKIVFFWACGFYMAFFYHFLSVFTFLFFDHQMLLPGMSRHSYGEIAGYFFPRSGTFEEGNFASLYYLLTFLIMFQRGKNLTAAAALSAVILTFSSVGIFSAFLFFVIYCRRYIISIILSAVFAVLFMSYFADKFSFEPGVSGAVRLNLIISGLYMFLDNLFLGVGIGGYGYNFHIYQWDSALSVFSDSDRMIANNVPVEILSEFGLLGVIFWSRFILSLFESRFFGNSSKAFLHAALISCGVHLLAFPTYNVSYLWVSIAILLKCLFNPKETLKNSLTGTGRASLVQ